MNFLPKISIILLAVLCGCDNAERVRGTLIMGPEVREFIPENQTKEYWVIDKADELYKEYIKALPSETDIYIPVTAELKVVELPKMQDGFGAEYDGTYEVVKIISITPTK